MIAVLNGRSIWFAQAMVEHMVGMGSKHEGGTKQPPHQGGGPGQDARRGREGYKV